MGRQTERDTPRILDCHNQTFATFEMEEGWRFDRSIWAGLADLTTFADEDLSTLAMYDDHALSILIDRLREHLVKSLELQTSLCSDGNSSES